MKKLVRITWNWSSIKQQTIRIFASNFTRFDKELFISDPDPTFVVHIPNRISESGYYPLKTERSSDRKIRSVHKELKHNFFIGLI